MLKVKRMLVPAVVFVAGVVGGTAATFSVLYDKPGRKLVWKIDRLLDRHTGADERDAASAAKQWEPEAGLRIEPHASGFTFPTRITFHGDPAEAPDAPFYYVAELGGAIKVVSRDGRVETFAEGLLNFERKPLDELGILGIAHDAEGHQLFASMTYWDENGGVYRNKVDRLRCSEDGRRMIGRDTILDMKSEPTVASYQIQFCALGPDDLLYVGIGSGARKSDAQNLDKFAGKVIRLNQDGSAATSNPFYDAEKPDAPRSYVYAYGMRNPFDIAWDPRSGTAVVSDVGPGIDRILRLEAGVNYCFELDENEMRANALYTWGPDNAHAPVGVTFLTNGNVGFDSAFDLCVGLFGQTHVPGANAGKRIVRFRFGLQGYLGSGARPVVSYGGERFASVTDVECGPDGLYFADFYGESVEPHAGGGVVYRVTKDPDWVPPEQAASALTGAARGRFLFQDSRCYTCHRLDGFGGSEGPALDHVRENLSDRLGSAEYEARLGELSARPGAYFQEQKAVYQRLLGLRGEERLRAWLHAHLKDPRFDNPEAKMPTHDYLSDADIDALADFLLGH